MFIYSQTVSFLWCRYANGWHEDSKDYDLKYHFTQPEVTDFLKNSSLFTHSPTSFSNLINPPLKFGLFYFTLLSFLWWNFLMFLPHQVKKHSLSSIAENQQELIFPLSSLVLQKFIRQQSAPLENEFKIYFLRIFDWLLQQTIYFSK